MRENSLVSITKTKRMTIAGADLKIKSGQKTMKRSWNNYDNKRI